MPKTAARHFPLEYRKENTLLEDKIRCDPNFDEILGESSVLEQALRQARTVASTKAAVLILGETGTGKELIARAVHRMSSRRHASFIKLDSAAIPTELLESELFGHEKGAFPGAVSQKIGRLELAQKGTLFLNELGELPMDVQSKLLRVLENGKFERLGGIRTIEVNVRLITATNRDLRAMVAEEQFRSDLYYRLNVFPIRMPALRERKEDIPLLVHHVVQKVARRMKKKVEIIPAETMSALVRWNWPGNVRELENFMERSVTRSSGPILNAPLTELRSTDQSAKTGE